MSNTMSNTTNNTIAIAADKVSLTFGTGEQTVIALDQVSVNLRCGELSLLMGPSGSGKSSLLGAMGGLQAPTGGKILVDQCSIWDMSASKINQFRREQCGFVFQSGGLFPSLTALKQVAIPLTYFGMKKKAAEQKAAEILDEVGLGDRLDSLPSEMSGGQNQRVSIARMLSKDPRLIFCDEPTSALDSENGAIVAKLLQRQSQSRQAMVLCVTHDDRLRRFADRVLDIADGKIVADSASN